VQEEAAAIVSCQYWNASAKSDGPERFALSTRFWRVIALLSAVRGRSARPSRTAEEVSEAIEDFGPLEPPLYCRLYVYRTN
jgi:hypothetical protein